MERSREARTCSGETTGDAASASGANLVSSCSSIRLTYFVLFIAPNRVLTTRGRITVSMTPIPRPWVKINSYGRCPIRLRSWRQHRIIPFLVLHECSGIYASMDPPIDADGSIVRVSASRNEIRRHTRVTIAELNPVAGTSMVGRPSLIAVTFSANRTPDEVALIRIQIMVEAVPVIELTKRCERLTRRSLDLWSVGVSSLETQIQLRQFGEVCQVNSRSESRSG